MRKILLILTGMLLAAGPAAGARVGEPAADYLGADWCGQLAVTAADNDLQQAIKEALEAGVAGVDCVKCAISQGYNPYLVIKQAVLAGGDPSEVIRGAREMGVTTAVISRATLDAGVDAGELRTAAAGPEGLGYTPLAAAELDADALMAGVLIGGSGIEEESVSPSVPR